ncbi:MAG: rpsB 1 [Proteobacteria bacterium]|nr:rpsB 1 [Pseudomonadota bacterium]
MAILIIETFILTAIAVGAGILVGVLVKQWFGRRTVGSNRLTEMMAAAAAAEADAIDREGTSETPALPLEQEAESATAAPAGSEVWATEPASAVALTGPAAEVSAGLDRIAAADRVGERPPVLPGPRAGTPDDLRRIRGIGPQNTTRLNALGIYHLDQIAAWTPAEARWVGAYLAFPGRIEREDWIGQAKALVSGRGDEAGKT